VEVFFAYAFAGFGGDEEQVAGSVERDIEIGEDTARGHLGEHPLNIRDEAHAEGLVLTDLILEDTEGFVQCVDDEIDTALAEGGFYGRCVGVEREGGASGDADGGRQASGRAAFAAGEDELAAPAFTAGDEFAIEAECLALEVGGSEHSWLRSE